MLLECPDVLGCAGLHLDSLGWCHSLTLLRGSLFLHSHLRGLSGFPVQDYPQCCQSGLGSSCHWAEQGLLAREGSTSRGVLGNQTLPCFCIYLRRRLSECLAGQLGSLFMYDGHRLVNHSSCHSRLLRQRLDFSEPSSWRPALRTDQGIVPRRCPGCESRPAGSTSPLISRVHPTAWTRCASSFEAVAC